MTQKFVNASDHQLFRRERLTSWVHKAKVQGSSGKNVFVPKILAFGAG
jgi:hypothetical protein